MHAGKWQKASILSAKLIFSVLPVQGTLKAICCHHPHLLLRHFGDERTS